MKTAISIKPHHFIDIITSIGAGQTKFEPHPYGHAVHTIAEAILGDPDTALRMELGADDICAPCKHNIDGICDDTIDTSFRPLAPKSKREWNLLIDGRWCERLNITEGDTLSAREFRALVKDLVGDLTDIYREIPAERTRAREADLQRGIELFLGAG